MRSGSLVHSSGRKSRSPTITGTSRDANVTETRDWQLAVLPSDEAYCGATPTEWVALLGQRRIVDHKETRLVADQAIRRLHQRCLDRGPVPNTGRDEMVQPIVVDLICACGHP